MTALWDMEPGEARRSMQPAYRFDQLRDWIFGHGITETERMTNLPAALRASLQDRGDLQALAVVRELVSVDGSIKAVLRGQCGVIETVWMPFAEHNTLCVSSQSGCAMGCTFCATATMPKAENLATGEILGQYLWATSAGRKVDRIVFMGMGEPLANYANVTRALHWFTHPLGAAMSPYRITVSTVGMLPMLDQFWEQERTHLAISLNGWDDASRQHWMPVGKRWSFASVIEWVRRNADRGQRRITLEYIVAAGHSDTPEAAQNLATALRGVPVRVNLIPWNDWGHRQLRPAAEEQLSAFAAVLAGQGVRVTVRRSRASDIQGACGQLVRQEDE